MTMEDWGTMRRIPILSIILCLSLSVSVTALDCQYTHQESYSQLANVFYKDNEKLDFEALTASVEYEKCISPVLCYNYIVKISNHYTEPIEVTVAYLLDGTMQYANLTIGSDETGSIPGELHNIAWRIDVDSVRYTINAPTNLVYHRENIKLFREVCDICPPPDDFVCLNDGQQATSDLQCGSKTRDVNGICISSDTPIYVIGDGKCHAQYGENCGKSADDCSCGANEKCISDACEDDCDNPPEEYTCCSNLPPFVKIGFKGENIACSCNVECIEHFECIDKQCKCNPSNPPEGLYYCEKTGTCKTIKGTDSGMPCDCDTDCAEGFCFQDNCYVMQPKVRCSNTNVKQGDTFSCNIFAVNPKLNQDVLAMFMLTAGSGLSFSGSEGCSQINGNQCIGTYTVVNFSGEGISVGLNANACGNTTISGQIEYRYGDKSITEVVQADFDQIHVICPVPPTPPLTSHPINPRVVLWLGLTIGLLLTAIYVVVHYLSRWLAGKPTIRTGKTIQPHDQPEDSPTDAGDYVEQPDAGNESDDPDDRTPTPVKPSPFDTRVDVAKTIRTKSGKLVQSRGEKCIADFLFDHKIDFDYDEQITLEGNEPNKHGFYKSWIRPDFYLTELDIIIEYWGLKGTPDYDQKMQEKKRLYKEANKKFISIRKEDLPNIDKILRTKLTRLGCLIE
jgi:hypothetical protein